MNKSFLVILVVCLAVSYIQGQNVDINALEKQCEAEKGKNCIYACMAEHLGIVVDGKLSADEELKLLAKFKVEIKDEFKQKLKTCIDEANKIVDECERANTAHTCAYGSEPVPKKN